MARRWKKFAGITLAIIVVLLLSAITFITGWRPIVGAKARELTARRFEATPARLERGKYLSESVMGCFDCHSELDASKPGAPAVAGKLGAGRVWADQDFPWLVAPNITPDKETGAANWSDDALARAIREGIGHDGRALFPIMPYTNYRSMSDEDLASVIAYLRSIQPVRNDLPRTKVPFPLNFFIKNVPEPLSAAVPAPDLSTPLKRGEYLTRMASCNDCHTPMDKGQFIKGMDFAGGNVFKEPNGTVASANITPDPSGIPYYDEDLFVSMMRTGKVKARQLHPTMRWTIFQKMTDDDLKSMFAYLRTLKPIKHKVDNTEPPTYCKLCKQNHGLGSSN